MSIRPSDRPPNCLDIGLDIEWLKESDNSPTGYRIGMAVVIPYIPVTLGMLKFSATNEILHDLVFARN